MLIQKNKVRKIKTLTAAPQSFNLIPTSKDLGSNTNKVAPKRRKATNKSHDEDWSAICYICYKRVFHLDTHLNRAFLSTDTRNLNGYEY